jgi:metal-responsive CopG/Arc/MetJ family transcriptional regulator
MKEKTSITLSRDVLNGIDRLAGSRKSRSAVIEQVLRLYLRQQERARIDARDLEILNRASDRLNAEVEDVLKDQADL